MREASGVGASTNNTAISSTQLGTLVVVAAAAAVVHAVDDAARASKGLPLRVRSIRRKRRRVGRRRDSPR